MLGGVLTVDWVAPFGAALVALSGALVVGVRIGRASRARLEDEDEQHKATRDLIVAVKEGDRALLRELREGFAAEMRELRAVEGRQNEAIAAALGEMRSATDALRGIARRAGIS